MQTNYVVSGPTQGKSMTLTHIIASICLLVVFDMF